jgi:hypothetical protein
MIQSLVTVLLCLTTIPAFSQSSSFREGESETKNEPVAYTNFLQGLSNIQEWATKLEAALRKQGDEIDRNKAKAQLLPKVVAIQKSLSDLEEFNRRVTDDVGTDSKSLNPDKLHNDLTDLSTNLSVLKQHFRDMREEVHVISVPEITDVERLGEEFVGTRDAVVRVTLRALGVSSAEGKEIDYVDLKERSAHISDLLHKAQDAFGELHRYLEK